MQQAALSHEVCRQIAHGIIGEAFSSRVVHPGVTTAVDVAWWMRQRAADLGLSCWFQPTVSLQRRGALGVDPPHLRKAHVAGRERVGMAELVPPGDALERGVELHHAVMAPGQHPVEGAAGGGEAGGKMKEEGTARWDDPRSAASRIELAPDGTGLEK